MKYQTLYELIGVSPSATEQEIKDASLKLGQELQERMQAGDTQAMHHFSAVEHAYEVLIDSERRAGYDDCLREIDSNTPLLNRNPAFSNLRKQSSWPFWVGASAVGILLAAGYVWHEAQEEAERRFQLQLRAARQAEEAAREDEQTARYLDRMRQIDDNYRAALQRIESDQLNTEVQRHGGLTKV